MATVWDLIFDENRGENDVRIRTHAVVAALRAYAEGDISSQAQFGNIAKDHGGNGWAADHKTQFQPLLDAIDAETTADAKRILAGRYGDAIDLVEAGWVTPAQAKATLGV